MNDFSLVIIEKAKRPSGVARWPAYVVDCDVTGTWLYSPKGCIHTYEDENGIATCAVGGGAPDHPGYDVMHFIPAAGWWIAAWCREHQAVISVDICTPPVFIAGRWRYTDLELDPLLYKDGSVVIDDEDEFAEACDLGHISPDKAENARHWADRIVDDLRRHREPFNQLGWSKLDAAIASALPPTHSLK